MLSTVLTPVTALNKLLFAFLILWILSLLVRQQTPRLRLHLPAFIVIAIFLYGFLIGLLARSDIALATQFFLASFVLALVHFIDYFRIEMDRAVELCGKALVAVTVIYWVAALNRDLPYASQTFEWLNHVNSGAFAERDFIAGAVTLTFGLGTAPFLFVPWCLVTMRVIRNPGAADLLWFALYGLAIGLSGARGLIIIALAFLVAALIWLASLWVRVFVILILMAIVAIIIPELLKETYLFSSDEVSNAVKIGHFNSFVESMDVWGAMTGNGLASYYYSSGKGEWMAHTELTPIDFARYVGIPLAIVFYSLLLFPSARLSSYRGDKFLIMCGFFLFLILSMTNPTLVNSYGMLCVVWYWSKIKGSTQTPMFTKMPSPFGAVRPIQSTV
jgi:hypothetical protein